MPGVHAALDPQVAERTCDIDLAPVAGNAAGSAKSWEFGHLRTTVAPDLVSIALQTSAQPPAPSRSLTS